MEKNLQKSKSCLSEKEFFMNYRIRMRNLREDRDLTQREVAQVINKSQQGYSHIEDGRA